MRILFGTPNIRLVHDIVTQYADVELAGVVGSWSECFDLIASAPDGHRIETVIVDAKLDSPLDRANGFSLYAALERFRTLAPELRIIVVTDSAEPIDGVDRVGAEQFIVHEPERAAGNLAALLRLAAKGETAKIIAIAGFQGGAGRTTIAQAIAANMSGLVEPRQGGRGGTLLWELDLKHPTIAYNQDVDLVTSHHGRRTIAKLINDAPIKGDDGIAKLMSAVVSGEAVGLPNDLLLAPHGIREVLGLFQAYDRLREWRERLAAILATVSRVYQVAVLDLSTDPFTDPGTQLAFEHATAIAVVAAPSPAGLSSVLAMREIIRDIHAEDRTRLILNRIRRGDAEYARLCVAAAQGAMSVIAQIPEDSLTDQVARQLAEHLFNIGA
jgi:MinD-like ATPase involved in chromosome partitioning or flagellar assembly